MDTLALLILLLAVPPSANGLDAQKTINVAADAAGDVTDALHAATTGASAADCLPLPQEVVSSANLTEKERSMLGDICWQPPEYGTLQLTTRDARPPGVECNPTTWCDGDGACSIVCERGSVKVEPWLAHALNTQNALARRLPLCMATMLGTHNSGITMADGYGNLDQYFEQYLKWIKWAGGTHIQTNNQWLSLTDQLNLGVRNVELDTHWVDGELRIAHCGGAHVQLFDKLIEAVNVVAKLIKARIRWDTETFGCVPSLSSIPAGDQRTFASAVEEVGEWTAKPENKREFLVMFLDDQRDLKSWGLLPRLMGQILAVFPRDVIFAPADLEAWKGQGGFPTMDELLDQGKRVMWVSGSDYGEDMADLIFPRGLPVCDWTEPNMIALEPAPGCRMKLPTTSGGPPGQSMLSGTILRTMTCELEYGPMNCDFVYRGINAPLLDEYSMPPLVACGLNMPCPDLLTPNRAASSVWSWAPGHPFVTTGGSGGPGGGGGGGGGGSAGGGGVPWGPSGEWATMSQAEERLPWVLAWAWRALQALRGLLGQLPARALGAAAEQASCSTISASDGRWRAVPCSLKLPTACKAGTSAGNATQAAAPWALTQQGDAPGGAPCPKGYDWRAPVHPQDNLHLQMELQKQGAEQAWLPFKGPEWTV